MEKLVFLKYSLSQLINIRKISTVHYLKKTSDYSTPMHRHEALEMVVCVSGKLQSMEDKNATLLSAGEMKIHQPSQGHCIVIGNVPTTAFLMSFVCKNECLKLFRNKVLKLNAEQKQLLSKLILELCNTFELNNHQLLLENFIVSPTAPIGAEQMVCSYLEQLLISLLRSNLGEYKKHADTILLEKAMENRIVSNIREYIDRHLSDALSIEFLSSHFHYSRAYISAKFNDATGQGISEYISAKRIEEAKMLLQNKSMNISQISDQLGYSSVQYFSRRFKQVVGCSPSEYIASTEPELEPEA